MFFQLCFPAVRSVGQWSGGAGYDRSWPTHTHTCATPTHYTLHNTTQHNTTNSAVSGHRQTDRQTTVSQSVEQSNSQAFPSVSPYDAVSLRHLHFTFYISTTTNDIKCKLVPPPRALWLALAASCIILGCPALARTIWRCAAHTICTFSFSCTHTFPCKS